MLLLPEYPIRSSLVISIESVVDAKSLGSRYSVPYLIDSDPMAILFAAVVNTALVTSNRCFCLPYALILGSPPHLVV